MIKQTFRRMLRTPVVCMAIILFSAAVATVLCALQNSKADAQTHYDMIYHEIKVPCTVTSLTGASIDNLRVMNWQIGLFTGERTVPSKTLAHFVTDVQIKGVYELDGALQEYTLTGITSTVMARQLWPENGCQITWKEGWNEAMFAGNAMACIIPQKLAEDLDGDMLALSLLPQQADATAFTGELLVVGIYRGGSAKNIYCPWGTLTNIWGTMGEPVVATALQATIRNNDELEALRQASLAYFQIPDPNAIDAGSLDLALDIDDSQLKEADLALRNSLRVNQLCAMLVLAFTAAAGFLIGFLMIRSRKREIVLMRTMGTPNLAIYFDFAVEQMLCAVVGIAVGGSYNLWNPMSHLGILAVVYFVGLTAALLVFLRKNLLAAMKEEE